PGRTRSCHGSCAAEAGANRPIFRCQSSAGRWNVQHSLSGVPSTDLDDCVGYEREGRHGQVLGGRTLTNATGGIVVRTMAGTEPSAEIAGLAERHTAEMGAGADHDDPVLLALAGGAVEVRRLGVGCD